ncbi:MAG: hypothetical protein ACI8TQ_002761 [Planctomycetota bacterium]|jgi:hypothetical protein
MSTTSGPENAKSMATPSQANSSDIACEDAARLTAAFVHGGLERQPVQLLHRHLDQCDECKADYRQALEAAGRLGASLRESKEPRTERETTAERNRRMVALAHATRKGKRNPFAMKALLLTAGMICLFTVLTQVMNHQKPASVIWMQGVVEIGDVTIGAETEPEPLIEASWCVTGPSSKARIILEQSVIELGAQTQLLLEDRKSHHFVFRSGSLVVDGAAEFLTSRGLVRVVDGLVSIRLKAGVLTVASQGGRLVHVSAVGEQTVEAGDPPLILN